jgi:hypothetical protein
MNSLTQTMTTSNENALMSSQASYLTMSVAFKQDVTSSMSHLGKK